MMPITARMPITGAHSLAPCGSIGSAIRTKPYVPSFRRIAARMTEPWVGAWVWASGSQVWNGNIGTLTAKPMNMPAKIQTWASLSMPAPAVVQVREARSSRAPVLEEQGEERDQHQRRAEHRVQEELQRGVLAILTTPHTDHEVHRQEHELEEDEEQDEVLGDERARHADLEDEHQHQERLRVPGVGHVVPGVDSDQERDHHRQEVQRQADAVETDRVVGLDHADPRPRRRRTAASRTGRSRTGRA